MSGKFRALFAAALAAAVTAAGPVTAADAAAEPRGLWLFEDRGYAGRSEYFTESWSNLADYRVRNWSDKATSLRNADVVAWVVYDDKGFSDRSYCIRPGEQVINLEPNPWRYNDKISSIRRLSTASCAGHPAFHSNA